MKFFSMFALVLIAASGLEKALAGDAYCARQAETDIELNLSAGVYSEQVQVSTPLKLRIPTGVNPHAYAECLKIHGDGPARPMVRVIAEARDCRRQAEQMKIISAGPGSTHKRIWGELDADTYADCLGSKIGVEVLSIPTE